MLIKRSADISENAVTDETVYLNRRKFIQGAASLALAGGLPSGVQAAIQQAPTKGLINADAPDWLKRQVSISKESSFSTQEKLTPFRDVVSYNNFYEFGLGKGDPARYAQQMRSYPWQVAVEGEFEKTGTYQLEDLLNPHAFEERIYRLRCVEAWSMVIPWIGFPLGDLLKRFAPTSKAKYIEFATLYDPEQMRGQAARVSSISWPYVEGLRIDEAMHPLTIVGVGLYGRVLPNQNGAPLRLVVPWKYGFKSIKSIVKIRARETLPKTTWAATAPREYGFYANVNPTVSHPRWSQSHERRLPNSLLSPNRIKTQMFNGYAEQVAHLYQGMDLRTHY